MDYRQSRYDGRINKGVGIFSPRGALCGAISVDLGHRVVEATCPEEGVPWSQRHQQGVTFQGTDGGLHCNIHRVLVYIFSRAPFPLPPHTSHNTALTSLTDRAPPSIIRFIELIGVHPGPGTASDVITTINNVCISSQGLANSLVWVTSDTFQSSLYSMCHAKPKRGNTRRQRKEEGTAEWDTQEYYLVDSNTGGKRSSSDDEA